MKNPVKPRLCFFLSLALLIICACFVDQAVAQQPGTLPPEAGWCCKDGNIFDSTLMDCKRAGGWFFWPWEVAERFCLQNRNQPNTSSPCGNSRCEPQSGENCSTCQIDCPCPQGQRCINGRCVPTTSCGNSRCEAQSGENCSTCPRDCPCPQGQRCINGRCVRQ